PPARIPRPSPSSLPSPRFASSSRRAYHGPSPPQGARSRPMLREPLLLQLRLRAMIRRLVRRERRPRFLHGAAPQGQSPCSPPLRLTPQSLREVETQGRDDEGIPVLPHRVPKPSLQRLLRLIEAPKVQQALAQRVERNGRIGVLLPNHLVVDGDGLLDQGQG